MGGGGEGEGEGLLGWGEGGWCLEGVWGEDESEHFWGWGGGSILVFWVLRGGWLWAGGVEGHARDDVGWGSLFNRLERALLLRVWAWDFNLYAQPLLGLAQHEE